MIYFKVANVEQVSELSLPEHRKWIEKYREK